MLASFHLARYPRRRALRAMVSTVTGRRALRATPGLRFARQLGTGRGSAMGLGGDLTRWATFAVWEDEGSLDRFLATSSIAVSWHEKTDELWSVRLALTSRHGSWGGADPFGEAADEPSSAGPVAVLTRATLPVRAWPQFYRSVAAVEADLHAQPGVLAVVGIGEAPVGLQATFSLWRSAADLEGFAYRPDSPHAEVIRRTRSESWFSEELFARFRPYASVGTWGGRDPLEGRGSPDALDGGNGS